MKESTRNFLLFILVTYSQLCYTQKNVLLSGMSKTGGLYGKGYSFTYNVQNNKKQIIYNYSTSDSIPRILIEHVLNDSIICGVSYMGGKNNDGYIYKFNTIKNKYSVLLYIEDVEYMVLKDSAESTKKHGIRNPDEEEWPLVEECIKGSDGNLYIMADGKFCKNCYGILFSVDPKTAEAKILHRFDGKDLYVGGYSHTLFQAKDGNIYGVCAGGSSNAGVFFCYDIRRKEFRKLTEFIGSNGAFPTGDIVQTKDSKMYGIAKGESAGRDMAEANDTAKENHHCRILYCFDPATNSISFVKGFNNTITGCPSEELILAKDNYIYGTGEMTTDTQYLNILYRYTISTGKYEEIYKMYVIRDVLEASDGNIYFEGNDEKSDEANEIYQYNPTTGKITQVLKLNKDEYLSGNLIQLR